MAVGLRTSSGNALSPARCPSAGFFVIRKWFLDDLVTGFALMLLEEPTQSAVQQPTDVTASKVPAATIAFWTIKILTTGMGEASSDFLLHHFKKRAAAVGVTALVFIASLAVQVLARRFHAVRYWTVVILVAIFGTMVADIIDFIFHMPLSWSTPVFAVLVGVVLQAWWKVEGTLSIHSIYSRRREAFYWTTVFLTFVLGTAAGDWTASSLHLGYLGSGFLFLFLIALPLIGFRVFDLNGVACFWTAYVLTRPLGASFADWMSEAHSRGGLGLGPAKVSLIWSIAIVVMVAILALSQERTSAIDDVQL